MKSFILCGVVAALAGPAFAGSQPQVGPTGLLQTTVSYADLDLSQPAGADVMVARIRRAAKLVCGDSFHADLDRVRHAEACMVRATNDALAQVGEPLVTARSLGTDAAARPTGK